MHGEGEPFAVADAVLADAPPRGVFPVCEVLRARLHPDAHGDLPAFQDGRFGRLLHVSPEADDHGVGVAPHPDGVGLLLFGHALSLAAHGIQGADPSAVAQRQDGDLALLPELGVAAVLLHGLVEHLGGGGAVDVAATAEDVQDPFLTGEPGEDAGLDGGEVTHGEGLPIGGDESRADELGQGVRHVAVAELQRLDVVLLQAGPGEVKVGDVVLRKILHLHQAPGPAAGPGSVELQQAVHPSVGAYAVEHRLVLRVGRLAHLRPDLEDAAHPLVGSRGEDLGEVLLREGVQGDADGLGEPRLELAHAVGVG